MYIPLGGSSTRILNVWLIFTFVALWYALASPEALCGNMSALSV